MKENGKGDSPRNNFSKSFRENYDQINWSKESHDNTGELVASLERILEVKDHPNGERLSVKVINKEYALNEK